MDTHRVPQVGIEVDPFPRRASSIWDDQEREEFINFISLHGEVGEEIPGTGGVRKVRWSRKGMGKRGGARVIYYYYNPSAPVYLLTVYAKSEKEDLSPDEKKVFQKVVRAI
jgi:hypothetical protein